MNRMNERGVAKGIYKANVEGNMERGLLKILMNVSVAREVC